MSPEFLLCIMARWFICLRLSFKDAREGQRRVVGLWCSTEKITSMWSVGVLEGGGNDREMRERVRKSPRDWGKEGQEKERKVGCRPHVTENYKIIKYPTVISRIVN